MTSIDYSNERRYKATTLTWSCIGILDAIIACKLCHKYFSFGQVIPLEEMRLRMHATLSGVRPLSAAERRCDKAIV